MNSITGRTEIEIGGVKRTLACDMNAADVLFQQHGDNWQAWLVDHFLGEGVELQGGRKGRKLNPLSPAATVNTLYALLATDREDQAIEESPSSLKRMLGLSILADVQIGLMGSILAGFGVPGEFIEAVKNAVDMPRKELATAAGIGTKR